MEKKTRIRPVSMAGLTPASTFAKNTSSIGLIGSRVITAFSYLFNLPYKFSHFFRNFLSSCTGESVRIGYKPVLSFEAYYREGLPFPKSSSLFAPFPVINKKQKSPGQIPSKDGRVAHPRVFLAGLANRLSNRTNWAFAGSIEMIGTIYGICVFGLCVAYRF